MLTSSDFSTELGYVYKVLARLSGKVKFESSLLARYHVYEDRHHAGKVLADLLQDLAQRHGDKLLLMAIPCGGVPVACEVALRYNIQLDLVICRKIQIPWNPEAGYGAVAPDGTVVLNELLVERLGLTVDEIKRHVEKTLSEIRRRNQVFRKGRDYYRLDGRIIILVDDGLASGYTMLAAVNFVKKLGAEKIYIAVPTASTSALELLASHVDEIYCPNIRSDLFGFAVADAYKRWHDLSDEEVLRDLERVKHLYIPWI